MSNAIRSLIDRWPTLGAFAEDAGVTYGAAKQMRRRGSIPPEHWAAIVTSKTGRELGLTSDLLMAIRAKTRESSSPMEAHR